VLRQVHRRQQPRVIENPPACGCGFHIGRRVGHASMGNLCLLEQQIQGKSTGRIRMAIEYWSRRICPDLLLKRQIPHRGVTHGRRCENPHPHAGADSRSRAAAGGDAPAAALQRFRVVEVRETEGFASRFRIDIEGRVSSKSTEASADVICTDRIWAHCHGRLPINKAAHWSWPSNPSILDSDPNRLLRRPSLFAPTDSDLLLQRRRS